MKISKELEGKWDIAKQTIYRKSEAAFNMSLDEYTNFWLPENFDSSAESYLEDYLPEFEQNGIEFEVETIKAYMSKNYPEKTKRIEEEYKCNHINSMSMFLGVD